MRPISTTTKKQALNLFKKGKSTGQVATLLNISQRSTANVLAINKENAIINKGGRPRRLTAKDAQIARLDLKRGRARSAVQATKRLNATLATKVSVQTVRRALRDIGMNAKKVVRRPALKKQHKAARKQFYAKYCEWTLEDWKCVVFSDESKFNRICSDGVKYQWDDLPGRITPRTVRGTVNFNGGNVKVWSCMSWYGPGFITLIDGTMDAETYKTILQEDLQALMEEWGLEPGAWVFQHDNDSKHTAKLVKKYLESVHLTEEEGTLLTWPARSQDLNPIEHMWSELERRLAAYEEYPKGCRELWARIAKEWHAIPPEFCQNLIKSMHNRLEAVRRAKGGNTKY